MSLVGLKFGHLILFFYFVTLYSQFFKAINRLAAISQPMLYRRYFTVHNIKWWILATWVIAGVHCIIYFFGKQDDFFQNLNFFQKFQFFEFFENLIFTTISKIRIFTVI